MPDAPTVYLDRVEELHDELLLARRTVVTAEHSLAEAITVALANGASWGDLGAAMGIRRQTAWDWFQRHH